MSDQRQRPPAGAHANAWNNAATGAGGSSDALDTLGCREVAAFGHVSGAATLALQVSANGTDWYDSQATQILSGAGDFCILATIGARFVRLKSSADVTATATIQAKD